MKKFLYLLLCIAGFYSYSFSQNAVYDFLRTDVGARAAALNGSYITTSSDPNVLFYNPASLVTIPYPQLSVGYFKHLAGIYSGSATYARPVETIGTVGIGVLYFNYGSFDRTDASDYVVGTFGASDIAIVAGAGRTFAENFTAGVNIEYIHSSIAEYSSSALSAGCGITYSIPSKNLTLGASVLHLGKQLSNYNGTNESLPTDVSIGLTLQPEHLPADINFTFHSLNESTDNFLNRFDSFTFGVEFHMSQSLRLRAGYNNEQRKDLRLISKTEFAGFAFGGGLTIKDYVIDYAYNSYGSIGGLHHVTVGILFR
ncbi:MAG TPA: type IX secretion system protein PorQ [Bacteroidota bacterium]|nr:type IX secretion system protein PorQ [Bacteroidota bacterium]